MVQSSTVSLVAVECIGFLLYNLGSWYTYMYVIAISIVRLEVLCIHVFKTSHTIEMYLHIDHI